MAANGRAPQPPHSFVIVGLDSGAWHIGASWGLAKTMGVSPYCNGVVRLVTPEGVQNVELPLTIVSAVSSMVQPA